MSQCKSITKSGKQCTRNALPRSRYCWQHNMPFLVSFASIIGALLTIIGFWADLSSLDILKPQKASTPENIPATDYQSLVTRGSDASRLGQYDEALNFYKQALVIARETEDRAEEGNTLNNIGKVYADKGQFD